MREGADPFRIQPFLLFRSGNAFRTDRRSVRCPGKACALVSGLDDTAGGSQARLTVGTFPFGELLLVTQKIPDGFKIQRGIGQNGFGVTRSRD